MWLPTPVFLPVESHGQRSLVGYNPWGCKESDTTEQLTLSFHRFVQDLRPINRRVIFSFLLVPNLNTLLYFQCFMRLHALQCIYVAFLMFFKIEVI